MEIQETETNIQKIVVFSASFGGINALIRVLSDLKSQDNYSVVIVQHLKQTLEQTKLHMVLNRHSKIRVHLAQNDQLLEPGMAYVAQPGYHLVIKNHKLFLENGNPVNHVKPASDVLFISAANAYQENVIGVVLTGTGKDGTKGCLMIKQKGGTTIAQDKETSEFFAMPENAIKTKSIDYILPLDKIGEKILALINRTVD